jgi:hypothetical protein
MVAHLRKSQALLNAAASNGDLARVEWKSLDLGLWNEIKPRWEIAGGRIRFHFFYEKKQAFFVSSIKPMPWGIRILLASPGKPVSESFDVKWQDSTSAFFSNEDQSWAIAKTWLKKHFPTSGVIWAGKRSDLTRSLSGRFLRVIFGSPGRRCLLIVVDLDSDAETHLVLSQALLWHSCLVVKPVSIHLLVPCETASILTHRCQLLNEISIDIKVWEYESGGGHGELDIRPASPIMPAEDKDFRWPVTGPFHWSAQLEQVLQMAPDLIRRYPRFTDYDSLRLWGLEFAQATGADRDRISFGVGTQRTELNEDNISALQALIDEILYYRRPDCPDIRHPYYRLQAERWLEALILENIPELFPELSPESVYSQIPVYIGKDPGRVDILGADRQGTLTIMELKVSEDFDMPLQALDYWGRVVRHNANGDFRRRGYFSEIKLNRRPPKIYLVSPIFSFHDSIEKLLGFFDPAIEIWKISINEDWRCGIRILRRISLTADKH